MTATDNGTPRRLTLADAYRDAEGVALWKAENGLAASTAVQVEEVREGGSNGED